MSQFVFDEVIFIAGAVFGVIRARRVEIELVQPKDHRKVFRLPHFLI